MLSEQAMNLPSYHVARCWLLLGTLALAIAGLMAIVLVLGRAPVFSSIEVFKLAFHRSLVVHVDLSVMVWFLAALVMLGSAVTAGREPKLRIPYAMGAAQGAFLAGIVLMTTAPLFGGEALMSNYIPVLTNPPFFLGLGLITAGIACALLDILPRLRLQGYDAVEFGVATGLWMLPFAAMAFYLSVHRLDVVLEGREYYDTIFWGGGHILQFAWTQLAMVAWLLLAEAAGIVLPRCPLLALFSFGYLAAAASLLVYAPYGISSPLHRHFFTVLMQHANGLAPGILGVWLIWTLIAPPLRGSRRANGEPWGVKSAQYTPHASSVPFASAQGRSQPLPLKGGANAFAACLIASLVVFAVGGILGWMIQGADVTIPAHYHGSIVGVTLALMGVSYLYLPRFGGADVSGWRMARWQPVVLAVGQLMHIGGLAWSGGYGVARKTPGAVPADVQAAMGFMGLGGLLAILGGLLFVVVIARSLRRAA